jgi:hypothetical protein
MLQLRPMMQAWLVPPDDASRDALPDLLIDVAPP